MKFGVVTFPGSNCDQDIIYVLKNIFHQETISLWHKETDLKGCDFIVLPGGFSYGDYLRSGAIARFSPIMESIIPFAENGGFVFGICNGFQILCEAGLLPGALLHNHKQQFICKNIYLRAMTQQSMITSTIPPEKAIQIPIAHGEGCYYAEEEIINDLEANEQILFKYCDQSGEIIQEANPNGSLNNIAGICNEERNVFGMMPHPERASDEELGNVAGKILFESILLENTIV